jgi:hypothetical protein
MITTNAVVQDVTIGLEGPALYMWARLNYGGTCQGFGGIVLGGRPDTTAGDHANQPNIAAEHIVGLLRACGVENVHECVGKAIRVRRTCEGMAGNIIAIGHIIDDDKWFNPKESYAKFEKAGRPH